jgi:uncharacterized protein (TIGR03086 family)
MSSPGGSAGLLDGAVRYARGSLACVSPALLSRPTPCPAWDLAALLQHVDDSLAAFHEGIAAACIGPVPDPQADGPAGLIGTVRDRADRLQAACAAVGDQDEPVVIADRRIAGSVVAAVGAVEIAVHGWDIAEACLSRQPIPAGLATDILKIIPFVVTDATRGARFGAPVVVSPLATPGDRLVALLGRGPQWRAGERACGSQELPDRLSGVDRRGRHLR